MSDTDPRPLTVRLDSPVRERLARYAAARRWSLSTAVNALLDSALDEQLDDLDGPAGGDVDRRRQHAGHDHPTTKVDRARCRRDGGA